jgi:hypothetical protein
MNALDGEEANARVGGGRLEEEFKFKSTLFHTAGNARVTNYAGLTNAPIV